MPINNKRVIIIIFVLIFIGFLVFLDDKPNLTITKKACIENKICFNIEIANTSEKRTKGLSGRVFMDYREGMLFIFDKEIVPGFWMKDMYFPIDIIWISKDNKIIGFEKNLNPCDVFSCPVVYPRENIKYALEINAGFSDIYKLEKGDKVYFNFREI